MIDRHSLDGPWALTCVRSDPDHPAPDLPDRIPATVPGTVHTDLLAAGLIDDPYLAENEPLTAWIGHTTWRYRRTVSWQPAAAERVELVFDGLDTVATIELNGVELGRTANQHRSHRFDVTDRWRAGDNELCVTFDSVWRYAADCERRWGSRPGAYPTPYNVVRKMAANFGWDWGPQLVTAGIWRGVRLEAWSGARLASVRPTVGVEGTTGTVRLSVGVDTASSPPEGLRLIAQVEQSTAEVPIATAGRTSVGLDVPDVRRWWPRGHGDQPRYPLRIRLVDQAGQDQDRWEQRIGFRTVALDTGADDDGAPFAFRVNDRPVFIRGANWIPDDCFLPRVTAERYRERIEQAVGANLNLLRVWGGGIYESDAFYDSCDELGVLTWQDFLFACAAYPEDEPLAREVEAEATENVERLMAHPSLVIMNGANENVWGFHDWGWPDELQGRSWGLGYYTDLLPAVMAEVAPALAYWPNSPYSLGEGLHPNDENHGNVHIWDVWNDRDQRRYLEWRPRFVSEFGFQGPPQWSTITEAIEARPTRPDSPALLRHQKADQGNDKLLRGLHGHLPPPRDVDEWHYLTQLNQARAIELAIGHFRSQAPRCQGSILWQLNDCWPVTSWSMIDGYGRRKPLWFSVRRASADRVVVVTGDGEDRQAVMINDTDRAWAGELRVERSDLGGSVAARLSRMIEVGPRDVVTVDLREVTGGADWSRECLVVHAAGVSPTIVFGAEDVDLALRAPRWQVTATPWHAGTRGWTAELTLATDTLARSVVVQVDRCRPEATVDDAVVDVRPDAPLTLVVSADEPFDLHDLAERGLIRSVNDVIVAR